MPKCGENNGRSLSHVGTGCQKGSVISVCSRINPAIAGLLVPVIFNEAQYHDARPLMKIVQIRSQTEVQLRDPLNGPEGR